MGDSATYSVVLNGNLKSGFETEQVVDAFAQLFKLTPDKAGRIVGSEFVLKRDVELPIAKIYREKLANIGIEAVLKRNGGVDELALEPIQAPPSSADSGNRAAPLAADEMICPKCELRQPRAEECSGCGVIVSKVPPPAEFTVKVEAEAPRPAEAQPADMTATVADDIAEPVGGKWIIAPLAVAVVGALLWYAIGQMLEYEFGAVAWLIGGAVGFVAVSSGARGETSAALCGLLVLLSIGGGKYMIVASQQNELAELLSTTTEIEGLDMRALYEEELAEALAYLKLPNDDSSLRRFMVEHEYSDYSVASEVPDEELSMFREFAAPRLEEIAASRPSFEEWRQFNVGETIKDLSTLDLLVENLHWMDIVFLFFGIGTAFQLVNRAS